MRSASWILVFFGLFLAPGLAPLLAPALAQAPRVAAPSHPSPPDCAPAGASHCLKLETEFWDNRLNDAYQQALQVADPAQAKQLRAAQRLWIQYRDANCLYYGLGKEGAQACFRKMTERRATELNAAVANEASRFPRAAGTWGGTVRRGPGQRYPRVASLVEGARVVLVEKSDVTWNGFPWFRIRFDGGEGFMWGGILCATGAPQPGVYQSCPGSDGG